MSGARLFAALELPGETRSALASWAARVSAREPAIRLVSSEALHVTLVFLGTQDESEIGDIADAVVEQARPLDPLAVVEAAWLPPHRPGVLVADLIEDGARLVEMHADLVDALSPWREPETRSFRPHVTVARVRRGERIAAREVAGPPRLIFNAPAVVLYRSHVTRSGSHYEALARAPV